MSSSSADSTWLGYSTFGEQRQEVYGDKVDTWLESGNDEARGHLASLLKNRLLDRYFMPHLDEERKFRNHPGFILAACASLMIESLQRFRMEFLAESTFGHGKVLFEAFFLKSNKTGRRGNVFLRARTGHFEELGQFPEHPLDFYNDIRCGILHVGEIRNGFRLRRYCYTDETTEARDPFADLPICDPDPDSRVIYADRLLVCVAEEVRECCRKFAEGEEWESFKKAMDRSLNVCKEGER